MEDTVGTVTFASNDSAQECYNKICTAIGNEYVDPEGIVIKEQNQDYPDYGVNTLFNTQYDSDSGEYVVTSLAYTFEQIPDTIYITEPHE